MFLQRFIPFLKKRTCICGNSEINEISMTKLRCLTEVAFRCSFFFSFEFCSLLYFVAFRERHAKEKNFLENQELEPTVLNWEKQGSDMRVLEILETQHLLWDLFPCPHSFFSLWNKGNVQGLSLECFETKKSRKLLATSFWNGNALVTSRENVFVFSETQCSILDFRLKVQYVDAEIISCE